MRITALLRDLREAGMASVAFTGGEPLLRGDLEDILSSCGNDVAPSLFTTGVGLEARRAHALRAAGLQSAFVSLDHFEASQHDRIRERAGAFDGALGAIAAFREAGVYTAAQAVIEPSLLKTDFLEKFLAFCRELGVHEVVLLDPIPVGNDLGQRLSAEQRQLVADLHLQAARDPRLPKTTAMAFFESAAHVGCQAGYTFVYVSTDGEVYPCDFVPMSVGNVYALGASMILQRLAETMPTPGSQCMAERLRHAWDTPRRLPLSWSETQHLLGEMTPGELPGFMRALLRNCPGRCRSPSRSGRPEMLPADRAGGPRDHPDIRG